MPTNEEVAQPFLLMDAPPKKRVGKMTVALALFGVAAVVLIGAPSVNVQGAITAAFGLPSNWWFQGGRCSTYGECPCADILAGSPAENLDAEVPDAATYDSALKALNLEDVKHDLDRMMTQSQDCWPADFGNYGPFFIRLAWHCSGTYRKSDGAGGCSGGRQRFEPERSWDDNTNLDKARALLVPIKNKYGNALSWGDLYALAGTQALRTMGTPITKFCFGRIDSKNGEESLVLGPTPEQEKKYPCKINGKCKKPLGATTLGLIYVNPEGPVAQDQDGNWAPNPDPKLSAVDVRNTFEQMKHADRSTVALIGGGHAFGKAHGACPAGAGPAPKDAFPDGTPWPGLCGTGRGDDTATSGFEGHWTTTPTQWSNEFFKVLKDEEWEKWVGPGGKWQWRTKERLGPYADVMRLTSDISLLHDRKYRAIVDEFANNQTALDVAFDEAWQELITHGGTWSKEMKCDHICVVNGQLGPCAESMVAASPDEKLFTNTMLSSDLK